MRTTGGSAWGPVRRWLAGLAVLAVVVVELAWLPQAAVAQEPPERPLPPPVQVAITELGFVPSAVTTVEGQSVVFTNDTAGDQSVTANSGLFASGTIPAGGAFAVAVPTIGHWPFASTTTPAFTGSISVGQLEVEGPADDPVATHLPVGDVVPEAPASFAAEETWGVVASRTTMVVRFAPSATVGDANRLLAAIDGTIGGQVGTTGLLMVTIPDRPDKTFVDLKAALELLRADPAVELAAMDTLGDASTVNPPAPAPLRDPPPNGQGFDPGPYPGTTNGAYGLVQARFPQAWNLLETIKRRGTTAQIAVVDDAFDTTHPEFADRPTQTPHLEIQEFCKFRVICASNRPSAADSHGTGVAGLIGGTNTGGDPVARLVGVPAYPREFPTKKQGTTFFDLAGQLDGLIKDRSPSGTLWNVRAINLSRHAVTFDALPGAPPGAGGGGKWAQTFANKLCGPGTDDDRTGTLPCTPNNEDGFLKEMANLGKAAIPLAEAASRSDVVIVQSSGNFSGATGNASFCVPFGTGGCQFEPIKASSSGEFGWASAHWPNNEENPILMVDAIEANKTRAPYSNVGGDVSAASTDVSAPTVGGGYRPFGGTSAAAPFVSALVGLVTAYDPSLTAGQIRNLIRSHARADTLGGAAPRIDAYATLLALPGALHSVLDVNDPSTDGNRRVIRFRPGSGLADAPDDRLGDTANGEQLRTAPDGVIGMADFRRFRDAFLQACRQQPVTNCPGPERIALDGGVLKQDLNFDGLYGGGSELIHPRMDPTGSGFPYLSDGQIPVDTAGDPLFGGPSRTLNGLQALQLLWGQRADGLGTESEGYNQTDLPALLTSGDVEVHADDLFAKGVTEATVAVEYSNDGGTTWTKAPNQILRSDALPADGFLRVVTVPISPTNATATAKVRARVSGSVGDKPIKSLLATGTVGLGGDIRLDPCVATATLASNPPKLSARQKAKLTLKVDACGQPVAPAGRSADAGATADGAGDDNPTGTPSGLTVDFTAAGTGADPADPEITREDTVIAPDGTATADVDAGGEAGDATFGATATFEDGATISTDLDTDIDAAGRLVYRWQQQITDYDRQSTNLFPDTFPFADFSEGPSSSHPPPITMTREGTIDVGDLTLDEAYAIDEYGWAGTTTTGGSYEYLYRATPGRDLVDVPLNDLTSPLTGASFGQVSATATDSGITFEGLKLIADLYVQYEECRADGSECTRPVFHGDRDESFLRLGPRRDPHIYPNDLNQAVYRGGDGTAFQFAPDLDADLRIAKDEDGSWRPYTFCASGEFAFPDTYVAHTGDPGNPPLEDRTGGGAYTTAFVATMVEGDDDPGELELPDCTDPTPPDARFTSAPEPGQLGLSTQFSDSSAAPSGIVGWAWDFGDGSTSTEPSPSHQYRFDGFYNVKLTVTDARGRSDSVTQLIEVRPTPPTAEVADATASADAPAVLPAVISSASALASYGLRVKVTSTAAGFPTVPERSYPAGAIGVDLGRIPAGVYPLTLTVTDYLDQKTTAYATLVVTAGAGAAPEGAAAAPEGAAGGDGPTGSSGARSAAPPATGATAAGDAAVAAVAELPDVSVPAVTIADATPATGAPVRVDNQTRTAGVPTAAVLDLGDGRADRDIGPGGILTTSWQSTGSPELAIRADEDDAGDPALLGLTVTGPLVTPAVTYTGSPNGAQGSSVPVSAKVTLTGSSTPLIGRTVTFTLDGATVDGVSAEGGVVTASLPLAVDHPVGSRSLRVEVGAVGASPAAVVTVPFTVSGNLPPVADPGGPYELSVNGSLRLDGSATIDSDGPPPTLEWDLGDDGTFERLGYEPDLVTWDQAQTALCGGTCQSGTAYPLVARATDSQGAQHVVRTTVTYSRDFLLTITPDNQILNPNGSTSFEVDVITLSGFSQPVDLTVTGLPAGVTARWTTQRVTPNGKAILTLDAGANAARSTGEITVTGTSGPLTRTTATTVTVDFGLVPICYGTFTGRLTDVETGAPLPEAEIYLSGSFRTRTDAEGRFRIEQVNLLAGSGPRQYEVTAGSPGYNTAAAYPYAACNVTTEVDMQALGIRTGSLAGRVVLGTADDPSRPSPTDTGVAGVPVQAADGQTSRGTTTDAQGYYRFDDLPLGPGNAPRTYTITGGALAGHYVAYPPSGNPRGLVVAEEVTTVTSHMYVPACTARGVVRVTDTTTGLPVPGATVGVPSRVTGIPNAFGVANGDGIITLEGITLNNFNAPSSYNLTVSPPPGLEAFARNFTLPNLRCGETSVTTTTLRSVPKHYSGPLTVRVIDDGTGDPLPNVRVEPDSLAGQPPGLTDAQGRVTFGPFFIGRDTVTQRPGGVSVDPDPRVWYGGGANIVLVKDQSAEIEVRLYRRQVASIRGTVTDLATGEPLANRRVNGPTGPVLTDAQGRYRIDGILLSARDTPERFGVSVSGGDGYFDLGQKFVTVAAGETATVDLQLVRQCAPAKITGRVFNAATGDVLKDVRMTTSAFGPGPVFTDAAGRFELSGLVVPRNTPDRITVQASKDGFVTATKSVTIFCGATITLDFGRDGPTGSITGKVTDGRDGSPVAGAFVGSEFGGTATTATDGTYTLADVPLGADGADQEWSVSVVPKTPTALLEASKSVTVTSGSPAVLDFVLGAGDPPPELDDDVGSTPFGEPSTVAAPGVLDNDTGTGLSVTSHTDPDGGSVTVAADGGYTYTPDAGFVGTDTFSYTVTDAGGRSATAQVTITVGPPAAPDANDDAATTPFGTALTGGAPGVLGNDTGTGLTVTSSTQPEHGTATVEADGSYSYTPDAGFSGSDTFTYTVTDVAGQSSTATVTVTVGAPPAPVANDDTGGTPFQTELTVAAPGVLANDTGSALTVTSSTQPDHGSVTVEPDGSYTYTPDDSFSGVDTFTYTVTDSLDRTATATVSVAVAEPPAAPVANDDAASTPYRTALTGGAPGALGNDTGSGLSVTGNTAPAHGTATVNADGSYTYTPDDSFSGLDSFTYTVTDSLDRTATATVTVRVGEPPAAPAANDDAASTPYRTVLTGGAPGVLGNDTGTGLSVTGNTAPDHGTATVNANGSYTYTPDDSFSGVDTFTYTVNDSLDRTATATVTVTVAEPPPAPVANDDAASTPYRTVLTGGAPGVLGNDTGSGLSVTGNTAPSHGTATVNANGSYTYTPDDSFSGVDTFTYTVTDSLDRTATATVTVTVAEPPPAPVANDDAASTPYRTVLTGGAPGVLGNDTGSGLSVTGNTAPSHGTATVNANGSYTYTPDDSFSGVDTFTYTVTDSLDRTATATVTVTVAEPPPAPVANDDSGETPFRTELTVAAPGVLGNDTGTSLSVTASTEPTHGTATVEADGSYTYTPDDGFSGQDSFTYTVTDALDRTATATVTVTVGEAPRLAVGDRVWSDTDADGVQDPGEPGTEGVAVQLADGQGSVLASTVTDGEGRYVFDDLAYGDYAVRVTAPVGRGFAPQTQGDDPQVDSDVDDAGRTAVFRLEPEVNPRLDPVQQTDGVTAATLIDRSIDAGLVPLPTGVAITKTVKQVGSTGPFTSTAQGPLGTTFTWRIEVTNPGQVALTEVTVTDPGFAGCDRTIGDLAVAATVAYECAGADAPTEDTTNTATVTGNTPDGAGLGEVTASATAAIELTYSVGDRVWEDLDHDGQQDAGEPGVAGATVELLDGDGTVTGTTTTAGDGTYRFDGLRPGTHRIRFRLPTGHQWTTTDTGDDTTDSDATWTTPNDGTATTGTLTLTDSQTDATTANPLGLTDPGLDAGVWRPASVGGVAFGDADRDGIRDDGETPIAGMTVELLGPDDTVAATTTTGPDGRYLFTDLLPGTYRIRYQPPEGFEPPTTQTVTVRAGTGQTDQVTLTPGQAALTTDIAVWITRITEPPPPEPPPPPPPPTTTPPPTSPPGTTPAAPPTGAPGAGPTRIPATATDPTTGPRATPAPLARTGTDTSTPLRIGLTLTLLGAALLLLATRRRRRRTT